MRMWTNLKRDSVDLLARKIGCHCTLQRAIVTLQRAIATLQRAIATLQRAIATMQTPLQPCKALRFLLRFG